MFVGNAKHQIDEKGRIRIPTKFRDELGAKVLTAVCAFIPKLRQRQSFSRNSAMWISVTAKACVL